ncbi:MAG: bestrophin family ion channel [Alphaproteobacteria bacterium]|nr:bestrophin family ion channel [Alphaproteobacteria bacterium]
MIVRKKPTFWTLFLITKGSIVPKVAPKIGFFMALSVLILVLDQHGIPIIHINFQAASIFGLALSLFLGFRNNAAYERWWEARKLWGQLIADIRSLARETLTFMGETKDRADILKLGCVFLHLHRTNLRRTDPPAELLEFADPGLVQSFEEMRNPACGPLNEIAKRLHRLHGDGSLSEFGLRVLTERLGEISLAQAGCERIAATPLPFVYLLLIYRTIFLYCVVVPFGMIDSAGWMAPIFTGVIAYVFYGLAAVTDELEHPFTNSVNGIPLDAMCRTVEISVAEALSLPPPLPLQPKDHILT